VTTGADGKGSQVTEHNDGHLEQNSPVAGSSIITENCSMMDRRAGLQYSHTNAYPMTPGVRYVTPVGSSLQTPFNGRLSANQHCNNMSYSQNLNSCDAGHFRPSHILNPMTGAHTMPEATPFQAIINPPENKYSAPHNSQAARRPCSWHVSPSAGQHSGLSDVGKTPSFRRTPGAQRSSPRVPHSYQPVLASHPLFQPSSSVRTGLSQSSNATLSLREFSEDDRPKTQLLRTASFSNPASVKPRSSMELPQFDGNGSAMGGVELVVSNLDYNISSHEWKKILTCELQQQVQVFM